QSLAGIVGEVGEHRTAHAAGCCTRVVHRLRRCREPPAGTHGRTPAGSGHPAIDWYVTVAADAALPDSQPTDCSPWEVGGDTGCDRDAERSRARWAGAALCHVI